MRRSDIRNLYSMQLNKVMEERRRAEFESDEKDRKAALKAQNDVAKLSVGLSILDMFKDVRGNIVSDKKSQTYGEPSYISDGKNTVVRENKRYEEKHDANWLERLFSPLEETEGYKKFKLERNKKEALGEVKGLKEAKGLEEGYQYDPATGEPMKIPASGKYSATKPDEALDVGMSLPEGYQYDPATGEAVLISDYQANQVKLGESYDKELDEFQFLNEDISKDGSFDFKAVIPENTVNDDAAKGFFDKGTMSWKQGEIGQTEIDPIGDANFAGNLLKDTMASSSEAKNRMASAAEGYLKQRQNIVLPENMDSKVKENLLLSLSDVVKTGNKEDLDAFTVALEKGLNNPDLFGNVVDDLTNVGTTADTGNVLDQIKNRTYTPGQGATPKLGEHDWLEDKKLQELRDLQTTPGVTPKVSSDSDLDKALLELENLQAPEVKGSGTVTSDQMMASAATGTDAPMSNQVDDGSGITMGKTFSALQNTKQMIDIGTILTDKETTAEQKGVASVQGLQMMSDLAAKKAGQETISQLGSKALTKKGFEQFSKQGVKLSGKQAAGAALGGAMGGYMMVTEGKAAGESWKEGDYDEAVLQGIGSVSGGLQAAGAGMMLTGVGAPIGAVLYGVGAAGSVISGVGQMMENLFEKQPEPKQQSQNRPRFDASHYLNSIRNR